MKSKDFIFIMMSNKKRIILQNNKNTMKNYLLVLVGISFIIFASCSNSLNSDDAAVIHDSIEIDLDEDGFVDYNINYTGVDIDPISTDGGAYGIEGHIRPLGKNEILRHRDKGHLFLRNLNDIKENVAEPLNWRSSFSTSIVTITTTNAEGDWPRKMGHTF